MSPPHRPRVTGSASPARLSGTLPHRHPRVLPHLLGVRRRRSPLCPFVLLPDLLLSGFRLPASSSQPDLCPLHPLFFPPCPDPPPTFPLVLFLAECFFFDKGKNSSNRQSRKLERPISASSTDHFYEGIENTLLPGDEVDGESSYWSSTGESDPQVPETLVYKLASDLCVITEIHVQPHEGYYEEEFGCPIYSSKAVRFHLGRSDFNSSEHKPDKFVWTYTSPEFPMIQRKGVQKFLLPEPVLCIGGILQIELLGRIIRHPLDGMYYICVSYVQALGRNLSPEFDVEIIDKSGSCILKHNPDAYFLQP